MTRTLKPLLAATLAGLLILGAAGLAVKPVMAVGHDGAIRARVAWNAPDEMAWTRPGTAS